MSAFEAHVTQQVTVTNAGPDPFDLDLFNYVDYDLNGTLEDDYAIMVTPELIEQGLGAIVATFEGIGADRWEIDEYHLQLDRFGDASLDNLSNSALAGPGVLDYTAAFQWSGIHLEPQTCHTVVEELNVLVPEPATLTLLLLSGLAGIRRR